MKSLVGNSKGFGFHSECSRKSLESFEQKKHYRI